MATSFLIRFKNRVLRPDATHDERIRRLFVAISLMLMVPLILFFGIADFKTGKIMEGTIVSVIVTLFISLFFILVNTNAYTVVVRLILAMLVSALFLEFYIGGGNGGAYQWSYLFPLPGVFLLGFKEGVVWCATIVTFLMVMTFGHFGYTYPPQIINRFIGIFTTVSFLACSMELLREGYVMKLKEEKQALEKALGEIRLLKGMVPICASCKKIRNDEGFWTQIEQYMKEHSDVEFSHGICPDCAAKLFPSNKKAKPEKPLYDV